MDWELAIDRNRENLQRIIAALFALVGLVGTAGVETLPRRIYRDVLLVLRPAESAVRRLIFIAATERVYGLPPATGQAGELPPAPEGPEAGGRKGKRTPRGRYGKIFLDPPAQDDADDEPGDRPASIPAFQLLDPLKPFEVNRKRYSRTCPRVRSLDPDWSLPVYLRTPEPAPTPKPSPDDPVSAVSLCRRLLALKHALDDIPGQARRFARWEARLSLPSKGPRRIWPLRPGWPPGHRKRHIHDVDAVLTECHRLIIYAQANTDRSRDPPASSG